MKELFVIIAGATLADVKGAKVVAHSWKDTDGNKHTVGALQFGDIKVRQTKDGRLMVTAGKKVKETETVSE